MSESAEKRCAVCGLLGRLWDREAKRWLCGNHHTTHCTACAKEAANA